MNLIISERFYSIQGEGVTTGIPSIFIRLRSCNLMCGGQGTEKDRELHDGATWRCDTIEVWLKGKEWQHKDIIPEPLLEEVLTGRIHLVFTGGEPLLQQEAIIDFMRWLVKTHGGAPSVEIETNGTVVPDPYLIGIVDYWNVSPKLPNSGMPFERCFNREALDTILTSTSIYYPAAQVIFKFVIANEKDWQDVSRWYFTPMPYLYRHTVLMPAGETQEQLAKTMPLVADLAKQHMVRMCSRLHIEIWNQKTGV